LTSQDSNTSEGVKSRFSVGIHKIPVELAIDYPERVKEGDLFWDIQCITDV
jgi:hypothetical protein